MICVFNQVTDPSDYFHPLEMSFLMPPPPPPDDILRPIQRPLDYLSTNSTESSEILPPPEPQPPHVEEYVGEVNDGQGMVDKQLSELEDGEGYTAAEQLQEVVSEKKEEADEAEELRALLLQSIKKRPDVLPTEEVCDHSCLSLYMPQVLNYGREEITLLEVLTAAIKK